VEFFQQKIFQRKLRGIFLGRVSGQRYLKTPNFRVDLYASNIQGMFLISQNPFHTDIEKILQKYINIGL